MSALQWQFQLDDDHVVRLSTAFENDERKYDLREEVRAGGNFCGVKYAAMYAAKKGVLNVSWSRYAKWRTR